MKEQSQVLIQTKLTAIDASKHPSWCQIDRHPYYYELKQQTHGLKKSIQNFWIKESGLNCNGYRIQAKLKKIIIAK
jgi:hypothetical protein